MIPWSGVDVRRMENAIIDGDFFTIRALIEEGRSINDVPSTHGYTCLWFACVQEKSLATIQLLLELGANPNGFHPTCNYTPLRALLEIRNLFAIPVLLSAGADPNAICGKESGITHMHLASRHGNPVILQTMMEAGGDPTIKNGNDRNALEYALESLNPSTPSKWNVENARFLIKAGLWFSEDLIRQRFGERYDLIKANIDAWRLEALSNSIPLTGSPRRSTI